MPEVYFISGHLDLTDAEFEEHYVPQIEMALKKDASFVVGDAQGADFKAQSYLFTKTPRVTVYHMFTAPRFNAGCFFTKGGFPDDASRDAAMTKASTADIAWIRPGREKSGTAKNVARRAKIS